MFPVAEEAPVGIMSAEVAGTIALARTEATGLLGEAAASVTPEVVVAVMRRSRVLEATIPGKAGAVAAAAAAAHQRLTHLVALVPTSSRVVLRVVTVDPAAIRMPAADLVTEAVVEETCRPRHLPENPVIAAMAVIEVEVMDQATTRVERRLWEVEGMMVTEVGRLGNQDLPGLAGPVVDVMT